MGSAQQLKPRTSRDDYQRDGALGGRRSDISEADIHVSCSYVVVTGHKRQRAKMEIGRLGDFADARDSSVSISTLRIATMRARSAMNEYTDL
jgi:hypothetical protein